MVSKLYNYINISKQTVSRKEISRQGVEWRPSCVYHAIDRCTAITVVAIELRTLRTLRTRAGAHVGMGSEDCFYLLDLARLAETSEL